MHVVCVALYSADVMDIHYDYSKYLQALLDRLVLVDEEAKSAALFNYEEAHLFGLR